MEYDDQLYNENEENISETSNNIFFQGSVMDAIETTKQSGKFLFIFLKGQDNHSEQLLREIQESTDIFLAKMELILRIFVFMCRFNIVPCLITPTVYVLSPNGEPRLVLANPKLEELAYELVDKITSATPVVSHDNVTFVSNTPLETEKKDVFEKDVTKSDSDSDFDKIKAEKKRLVEKILAIKKLKDEYDRKMEKEQQVDSMTRGASQKDKDESNRVKILNQKARVEKLKDQEYKDRLLDRIKKEKEQRKNTPVETVQQSPTPVDVKAVEKPQVKSPAQVKIAPKVVSTPPKPKVSSGNTMIAFKMPDGSVSKVEFSVTDYFQSCRTYVNNNYENGKQYDLYNAYPRRMYTESDLEKSIGDLGLSGGTILVVPRRSGDGGSGFNNNESSSLGLMSCPGGMFVVFTSVYEMIAPLFRSTTQSPPVPYERVPDRETEQVRPPTTQQSNPRSTTKPKTEKKVHGFEDIQDESDDKDQKFNNGNSTQFQDALTFEEQVIDKHSTSHSPVSTRGYEMVINHLNYSLLIFGGFPGADNKVYEMDMTKKSWRVLDESEESPCGRFGHNMQVHYEFVFCFGGEDQYGKKMNDVWLLNLATHVWKRVETEGTPPRPRSNHTSCWRKGTMIIYGGEGMKNEFLSDVHILDLEKLTWKQYLFKDIIQKPVPLRASHAAAMYGQDMIVFGGKSGKGLHNDLYLFDFDKGAVMKLKTKYDPPKRLRCQIQVRGGVVFVYGGFVGSDRTSDRFSLNDLYIMRLDESKWIRMNVGDVFQKEFCYRSLIFQGKMISLGGEMKGRRLKECWVANVDEYTSTMNIPFNELKLEDKIAEGVFRDVYKGKWRMQDVAIKMMKGNNPEQLKSLIQEAEILRSLIHPSLQQFRCFVAQDPFYCLVTEYCDGRSLGFLLSKKDSITLDFEEKISILIDIARALQYLESKKLVYGVLSPKRCLITSLKQVKVSDYFLTVRPFVSNMTELNPGKIYNIFGSPHFIAPEILSGYKATIKSDIFSLGSILWVLYTLEDISGVKITDMKLVNAIIDGARPCENLNELINDEKEEHMKIYFKLIRSCWKQDPDDRPNPIEVIEILKTMSSSMLFSVHDSKSIASENLYEPTKVIGKGGQAVVFLVKRKDNNQEFALKKYNERPFHEINSDLQEMKVYLGMNHPNVVEIHDFFFSVAEGKDNKGNAHFNIVMDYCNLGDLEKYLKKQKEPLSKAIVRSFIQQMMDGINYIHQKGFIHRDLKPGNIFLSSGLNGNTIVRIGDLGLAKRSMTTNETFCGSLGFMSPEQRNQLPYDQSVDIWSFGAIVFQILSRREFHFSQYMQDPPKYLQNEFESVKDIYDAVYFNICMDCLQPSPNQRPNAHTILNMLNGTEDLFLSRIKGGESVLSNSFLSDMKTIGSRDSISSGSPRIGSFEELHSPIFKRNSVDHSRMTIEDVGQWIVTLGLKEYKNAFITNEIDGLALLELDSMSESVLKEFLGMNKLGSILKLKRKIRELKESREL